ncbi:hypothetical protein [[Eubacterium] hominis]|uniref:hypothetical protein n=1 Tax=[Eubacterium] hominis TaxID=2764325 RepID=UPI003A4D695A
MLDKKGMILIETLLLFVVVSVLILIVTSCVMGVSSMEQRERELFQNDEIRELYQR